MDYANNKQAPFVVFNLRGHRLLKRAVHLVGFSSGIQVGQVVAVFAQIQGKEQEQEHEHRLGC
jgi:hypothetical protein